MTLRPPDQKPKHLDQVGKVLRTKHYSIRTEKAYNDWIYRFIIFHTTTISPNWITGLEQRHHLSERTLQRAFNAAIRKAGITKHVSCYNLRHSGVYPVPFAGSHICWNRVMIFARARCSSAMPI